MVAFVASSFLVLTLVGAVDSVEAVRFGGNHAFSGRRLMLVVSARAGQPLDERRLDADVRALEQFYQSNGFRTVQAGRTASRGRRRFVVAFNVVEGRRTRVGEVVFTGNAAFESARLARLLPAKPGGYYTSDVLSQCVQVIRDKYLNSGYPFVGVDAEWRFTDSLATLAVDVFDGPRCVIGELRVRGNVTVRTATILRALEVKRGELFRQRRLQEAQRRLYATGLFQRVLFNVVTPVESAQAAGSVVIRFDVAEQPYRVFTFGGGVEMPPLRLLVSAGWEHDNVLNRGQEFDVGGQYSPNFSGDFRASVDAHYRVPYLIFTRIDFQTHPFFYWERVDTALRRDYGIETGLSRNVSRHLSFGLFNRVRLVADTSRGITNSVAVNALYDSRNDFFDPRHGLYLKPAAEVAGGLLRGDNDFYRLTAEARWFQAAGPGLVFAARVLVGRDFTYGRTTKMPYYEGFTLGGRSSLRGYADQSLGPDSVLGERFGPMVLNTNLELRTPYVFDLVGLVVFLDGGEVVDTGTGFTTADYQYSAGAGIRVLTPIGPVRLDWGKRLRNPPPKDRGKFYLGLLHAF